MKKTVVFVIAVCAAAFAADKAPAKKAADKPPAKASADRAAQNSLKLPAGAVQTEPGTWSYTDPAGKKWTYRQTPFGLTRFPDKTVQGPASPEGVDATRREAIENWTAADKGDTVAFERPGPFGRYKWQRKKTELSETEQKVWDRERAKADAARTRE